MANDAASLPHYVRRRDRAVEDEGWIRAMLKHAPFGVLATVYEGHPFINTNLFVFDEAAHSIYLHTAREGRTRTNVEENDRVCFSVSEMGRLLPAKTALGFSVEYAGVVVFGRATIVTDEAEARHALQLLLDKYFPHLKPGRDYQPIMTEELAQTTVYRIQIEHWSGKKKEVEADFPDAFYYGNPPNERKEYKERRSLPGGNNMSDSRAYFAEVAGQWDELRAAMYSEAVREAAITRGALRPGMVVADVGAGTGFIARGLAPYVARVYVIDNSMEMLSVARRNLSAFTNVEYCIAEGTSLPLPDESLEAVFANMYLHHTPDPPAAIREMARTLKPGGRLVITDMDQHEYTWLREEHHDVWLGFDRAQVQAWFGEAGLANVVVECTGELCCAESQAQKGRADVSIFVAVGTKPAARK